MKIIVAGCGRWGSGLAELLSQRGHGVTVVDAEPAAFDRLGPSFRGQTVVGSGYDRDVLVRAGIERADGVAAATASDEANVVIGRAASHFFRVPRVVARVYDPRKAAIYRRLGLPTVAPIPWGIHRMAEVLLHSPLGQATTLGTGEVEVVGAEVPALLVGRTVNELLLRGEIHPVALTRGGKTFLPSLGTVFLPGDVVHLAVVTGSAERLKALLGLGA